MLADDSEVLHDNLPESGTFDSPDFNILPEEESSRSVMRKFELFGGDIDERDQDRAWVDETACREFGDCLHRYFKTKIDEYVVCDLTSDEWTVLDSFESFGQFSLVLNGFNQLSKTI